MINNADHLNETNGIIDSTLPRPWLRTSLLYEYFSESERSYLNPLVAINGKNVTEVDFHVNASFDYMKETGFWDDGEKIDEEWWFKNTENDTETLFPVNDQVKIGRVEYKSEINLIISQPYIEDKLAWLIYLGVDPENFKNLTYIMELGRYDGGNNERFQSDSNSF